MEQLELPLIPQEVIGVTLELSPPNVPQGKLYGRVFDFSNLIQLTIDGSKVYGNRGRY